MNENLSEKIIERIEVEKIKPLPRWRFVILQIIFWLSAILTIIFGSMAIAAILFLFFDHRNHGLSIPHETTEALLLIPYAWIILLIIFVILGQLIVRHTKKGYHYKLSIIIFVSLFSSIIIGDFLYTIGVGKITHEFFQEQVPAYNYITYDSRDIWDMPKIGKIAGVITAIEDNENFYIIDFSNKVWHVHIIDPENKFVPEASSTVRISGKINPEENNGFIVDTIYEWEE